MLSDISRERETNRFHSGLLQNFHLGLFRMKKGTPDFAGIPFGFAMVPKGGLDR
jgi:hypothetical protein